MVEPDTKAAIARSKSRYKGARSRPSRSVSTPSVPAVPPVEASPNDSAGNGRTRPTTTINGFPNNVSAIDDDDKPLITLLQGQDSIQPTNYQVRTPGVPTPRPTYDTVEPRNGPSEKRRFRTAHAQHHAEDFHRHQSQEQARAQGHSSRPVRAERGGDGRNPSFPQQEQRRLAVPAQPAMLQKKSFTQRIAGLVNPPQSAEEAKAQLKQMISSPIAIEDETPPPVEQFDAPKSAVNAGERMVRVKYKEFQVPVTIIPSTTPGDVIRSVSEKVAEAIDSESSVMLEAFKQLGLERPLRRYEHIRDVLNSWDSDSQNTLVIEPSTTRGYDTDLDVRSVPREQPDDSSFQLYYSQRPAVWNKREVVLRSGQLLVAKPSSVETTNICHLSDFDIYIPTTRQVAKKIRPPKRICFAVKSQQKSNMFMSTVNFVHFFSSNDKKTARAFYNAVQEWRSWYLVNRMGKGGPTQPLQVQRQAIGKDAGDSTQRTRALNQYSASQPARLRTSFETSNKPPIQQVHGSTPSALQTTPRKTTTSKDHGERQDPLTTLIQHTCAKTSSEAPFSDGGLLGRAYTGRQKEPRGRKPKPATAPAQQPASPPSPIQSSSNELKRSSSQLKKPKPLVDLTPRYQEAPQHSRKGKGVVPDQIPAGGLIDIATSPEVAIPVPPTMSWRRPGTSPGSEVSPTRHRS
ncbi:MAG: hypothetical protein L6R39_000778 [Caloplaca ligustica]|nr:MAG: hypothetical protein L6R39_000778 [Caloplaca ligustica]